MKLSEIAKRTSKEGAISEGLALLNVITVTLNIILNTPLFKITVAALCFKDALLGQSQRS